MDWKKDFEFIKQGSPLIIAVDFDDTLAKAGEKYPEIGEPTYMLPALIEWRKILKEKSICNLFFGLVELEKPCRWLLTTVKSGGWNLMQ